MDFYLGMEGGRDWEQAPGSPRPTVFLLKCVGWAWAAFRLQREIVDRFEIRGPFRAILGVANTTGAFLGTLGVGWTSQWSIGIFGEPTAVEPRVLLLEDLTKWPEGEGVEELALRFGARLDLAFGGTGERHLDRAGPAAGTFNPRW